MTSISCLACNIPTPFDTDQRYRTHLLKVHGANSPDEAMAIERAKKLNVPPDALPTPEFIEAVKRIEEKKQAVSPPILPIPQPVEIPVEKKIPKLIVLEYKYKGDCTECGKPIKTFVTTIRTSDGFKTIAFAHCDSCIIQFKDMLVEPIREEAKNNGDEYTPQKLSREKTVRPMSPAKTKPVPNTIG